MPARASKRALLWLYLTQVLLNALGVALGLGVVQVTYRSPWHTSGRLYAHIAPESLPRRITRHATQPPHSKLQSPFSCLHAQCMPAAQLFKFLLKPQYDLAKLPQPPVADWVLGHVKHLLRKGGASGRGEGAEGPGEVVYTSPS